jgi:hypothetical protein
MHELEPSERIGKRRVVTERPHRGELDAHPLEHAKGIHYGKAAGDVIEPSWKVLRHAQARTRVVGKNAILEPRENIGGAV